MSDDTLTTLFRHNRWANEQLLAQCAALSPEQLAATATGTFGSIRDTLAHIVAAERGYLARISTGERYAGPDDTARLSLAEMATLAATTGDGLIEWAGRVRPGEAIVIEWEEGTPHRVPKTLILTQAINHATEHRAQIAAILTQLGIEPLELSGWAYFEAMQGAGEQAP